MRLANKVVYFTGIINPDLSEISQIRQGEYRNLAVKKIIYTKDNKPNLEMFKIQFKEEKQGQQFFEKFKEACKKWFYYLIELYLHHFLTNKLSHFYIT